MTIVEFFDDVLIPYINNSLITKALSQFIAIILIIIFTVVIYYFTCFIIKYYRNIVFSKLQHNFITNIVSEYDFTIFGHLFSAYVLNLSSNFAIRHNDLYSSYIASFIHKISIIYLFIAVLFAITRLIELIQPYYKQHFILAKYYPIKQYLNVIIIFTWLLGVILLLVTLTNSSFNGIFAGFGALSAIFILIFKDTILNFIASIQVATSRMISIGDKIYIKKYNIEGIVTFIAIHTITIRGIDNTITTIPTYMLTSEIVTNYSGIATYGTRLIKRVIYINSDSIVTCTAEQLITFTNLIKQLSNYDNANKNIDTTNNSNDIDCVSTPLNLSLFCTFINYYLKQHVNVVESDNIVVRCLEQNSNGALPIEIIIYVNILEAQKYMQLKNAIIEYIIQNLSNFELKLFQTN